MQGSTKRRIMVPDSLGIKQAGGPEFNSSSHTQNDYKIASNQILIAMIKLLARILQQGK
jgi:hypothetical protein